MRRGKGSYVPDAADRDPETTRAENRERSGRLVPGAWLGLGPWFLTIIATLDGFNDMDSVEVFRWDRDGFEVCG